MSGCIFTGMAVSLQYIREGFVVISETVSDVDDGRRPQDCGHQQEQAYPFTKPLKLCNERDTLILSSRT